MITQKTIPEIINKVRETKTNSLTNRYIRTSFGFDSILPNIESISKTASHKIKSQDYDPRYGDESNERIIEFKESFYSRYVFDAKQARTILEDATPRNNHAQILLIHNIFAAIVDNDEQMRNGMTGKEFEALAKIPTISKYAIEEIKRLAKEI